MCDEVLKVTETNDYSMHIMIAIILAVTGTTCHHSVSSVQFYFYQKALLTTENDRSLSGIAIMVIFYKDGFKGSQ